MDVVNQALVNLVAASFMAFVHVILTGCWLHFCVLRALHGKGLRVEIWEFDRWLSKIVPSTFIMTSLWFDIGRRIH